MGKWLKYSKQRFPIVVYLILSAGFSLSANYILFDSFSAFSFAGSFLGVLLFFFELRLMDEYKDYEKDKIAHPSRPIPRGLLTLQQVKRAIQYILGGMFGYAFILGLAINISAGIYYFLLTIYLYLMYREFFISNWLNKKPILYAVSHQLILIILCAFSFSCFFGYKFFSEQYFQYSFLALFSFFSYEICRKLNPNSHVILKTYLSVFGMKKVFGLVCILSLSSFLTLMIQSYPSAVILIPVSLCLLLSAGALLFNKNLYKLTEAIASLSLLLNIWSGVLNHAFI